jgi:hypothetical protein
MPEDLMERTESLVKEYGAKWTRIVGILTNEGFKREDNSHLTVDTIRKRYKRWSEQRGESKREPAIRTRKKNEIHQEVPSPMTENESPKSHEKNIHTTETTVPVGELLELFKGSLERRDQMLAEKLKNDAYSDETESRIISMEARLEEKLLKRLKEELLELVQDQVDAELKTMVSPGGSFERDLKTLVSKIIDEQGSDDLVSLMEGIEVSHKRPPGPGRGHKGKKTSRFSATMDEETYKSMKDLRGTFSGHLTAACQLYLRALEAKKETY